jgi:UDP-3-O-[3-hydroxymyristoyl] glucosamine N-acyltransferase
MSKVKTLKYLSEVSGSELIGNPSLEIRDIATIEAAREGDITFISNPKYRGFLATTKASAIVVSDEDAKEFKGEKNLLLAKDPYLAFTKIISEIRPTLRPTPGVHKRSEIAESAALGNAVSVGAFTVIEGDVVIGDGSIIYPNVYIGQGVSIGQDAIIYPGVCIREGTRIGSRVIIHCNSVIASDGYGYAKDGARHIKIPQTGIVTIADDVEIGAAVTIDRAAIGKTVIGRGTKIDNLVQIAHNVEIGEDSLIIAQVGISGSSTIGDRVTVAGQAGMVGHVHVTNDAIITARAVVTKNITAPGAYSGYPAIEHSKWLRAQGAAAKLPKKLPELKRLITDLEARIKTLEDNK